jgi:hypothetical protein
MSAEKLEKRTPGRPRDLIRDAWVERFGITRINVERDMPNRLLVQLSQCASDAERRLILGVSEKYTQEERELLTPHR